MSISVVIPSRNGWSMLRKNLPLVVAGGLPEGTEIVVVDDCSDDQTSTEGPGAFPDVRFIRRTGEPGFCHAVNQGMSEARGDMLLLLNNDVVPEAGAFSLLGEELARSPGYYCAAVPVIRRPDGSDEGDVVFRFHRGIALTSTGGQGIPYPSGACSLWRRSSWEDLQGLDTDYAPIYWEDTDIGARAYQRGWKVLKVGSALVLHDHAATMGHSPDSMALRERNRLVFTRKNFRRPPERLSTFFWMPIHLLKALLTGNRAFLKGYSDFLRSIRNTGR